MVIVAFRKDNEKLTSVCSKTFKNAAAAKQHIEDDAAFFCTKHPGSINCGWIKPKTLDYYMVTLKNDVNCYWQYFNV